MGSRSGPATTDPSRALDSPASLPAGRLSVWSSLEIHSGSRVDRILSAAALLWRSGNEQGRSACFPSPHPFPSTCARVRVRPLSLALAQQRRDLTSHYGRANPLGGVSAGEGKALCVQGSDAGKGTRSGVGRGGVSSIEESRGRGCLETRSVRPFPVESTPRIRQVRNSLICCYPALQDQVMRTLFLLVPWLNILPILSATSVLSAFRALRGS